MTSLIPFFIVCIVFLTTAFTTVQSQFFQPLNARECLDFAIANVTTTFPDAYLTSVVSVNIGNVSGIDVTFTLKTGQGTFWAYQFYSPSKDSNITKTLVKYPLIGCGELPFPLDLALGDTVRPVPKISTTYSNSTGLLAAFKKSPVFLAYNKKNPDSSAFMVAVTSSDPMKGEYFPRGHTLWMALFNEVNGNQILCLYDAVEGGQPLCLGDAANPVSEEELNEQKIIAYPNPMGDIGALRFDPDFKTGVKSVKVFDTQGREKLDWSVIVRSQILSTVAVPTGQLESGVYFVKVVSSNGEITIPLIKE